jgi:hypothetical protein
METYIIVPSKDPTKRQAPQKVSSVYMQGNWTYHAYSMAHDGRTNIVHRADGIEVHRSGAGRPTVIPMAIPYIPRDFMWHPDCKRVAFWVAAPPLDISPWVRELEERERAYGAPKRERRPGERIGPSAVRSLAVMDTTRLPSSVGEDDKPYEIIYQMSPTASPFGVEWSPKGEAVFVIERAIEPTTRQNVGTITRIDLNDTSKPRVIVTMPGMIDFFMPPTSRFERGEGPSTTDYKIVFGHIDGLYLCGPEGDNVRRVSNIPAVGLYNVEWNPRPTRDELILFFKRPVTSDDGRTFTGVYRVSIPRGDEAPTLEQVYDSTDIHTLWYSPRGTYMTWASPNGIWFRRPEDGADKVVQVDAPVVDGAPLEVKGVSWSDDERKLAFVATNRLYVCEVPAEGAAPEPYEVATFGETASHFAAEPRWVGDQVFLSVFENAEKSGRLKRGIDLNTPDEQKKQPK